MTREVCFSDAREMAAKVGEVIDANEGLGGRVDVLVFRNGQEIVVSVTYDDAGHLGMMY